MSQSMTASSGSNPDSMRTAASGSPDTLGLAIRVFFRYFSPRVLCLLATASLIARLAVGHWTWWDLAVTAAIVVWWPFQEWLIHVRILHFKPIQLLGRTIDLPVAREHRKHHRNPWQLDLLFIPKHVFLYGPFVLAAFWFAVMPTTALALTGLTVYWILAFHYEWSHYIVHVRYTPKSWNYRRLWHSHRLHHFKNENYWWGVSMLSGDKLLHTAPDHKAVESSPLCRDLDKKLGVPL